MRPRPLPVAFLALGALASLPASPAAADQCHHKGPVEQCLKKGGDLLTCSCLNGGPCEGALFTVACGHGCDELGEFDHGDPVDVSIDFYDGGGKLLYRDDGAYVIARNGHDGGAVLMATGNLERTEFEQWFRGANSLSSIDGLTLQVYDVNGKGKRRLIVGGPNVTTAHALYAEHCGDVPQVKGKLSIDDETTRALAAEAVLEAEIQQEIADRVAADQTLARDLATSERAWQDALQQELEDRRNGDAAIQVSINTINATLAQETANRQAQDAALQASVTTLTATVNNEIARAQAAEGTLTASVNTVAGNLAAEIARAQAAEAGLSASIAAVGANLNSEIARAQAAEANLLAAVNANASALAAEVSRAQTAEGVLGASVNSIAAGLASETSARSTADQALINAITGVQNNLGLYQTTLAGVGLVNNPANPVDWSQLKNVPPGVLAGGGISSLNGLIGTTQSFAVGAAGNAPGWVSAAGVHTLNLPMASASATGVINGASELFIHNQIGTPQQAQLYITASDFSRTARIDNSGAFGYAVRASNTAAGGFGTGGAFSGTTAQSGGYAFFGSNLSGSGTGVYGEGQGAGGRSMVTGSGGAFSGSDTGVFAYAATFGVGQAIYSNLAGNIVRVNYWDGSTQYKIQGTGTVSTLVKDPDGRSVVMHAPETPEIYLQDFGSGRLVNGRAHVELDPTFAKNVAVSPDHPMRVFIQLEDDEDILGVVVKNKTAHGFDVVERGGGHSNAPFQWQITCNRADEDLGNGRVSRNADRRFEPAAEPAPLATPPDTDPSRANAHPLWRTQAPAPAGASGPGVFARVLAAIAGPR